jgi:hypothetical protein
MNLDLSKYISGIKIESAFLPEIYLPEPFKPGPPNTFLQALKPKITVMTKGLGDQVVTPYGDPGQSYWPLIKQAALMLAIGFMVRKLLK